MLLSTVATVAHGGDKVTLMVGGIEKILYLPAALGEQPGAFQEQDLDVEIRSEPVGNEVEDELLAGAVDGVVGFYDHAVDLQARKIHRIDRCLRSNARRGRADSLAPGDGDQIAGRF
jgi:NitT/TauT family transport system substrate-binding protein